MGVFPSRFLVHVDEAPLKGRYRAGPSRTCPRFLVHVDEAPLKGDGADADHGAERGFLVHVDDAPLKDGGLGFGDVGTERFPRPRGRGPIEGSESGASWSATRRGDRQVPRQRVPQPCFGSVASETHGVGCLVDGAGLSTVEVLLAGWPKLLETRGFACTAVRCRKSTTKRTGPAPNTRVRFANARGPTLRASAAGSTGRGGSASPPAAAGRPPPLPSGSPRGRGVAPEAGRSPCGASGSRCWRCGRPA